LWNDFASKIDDVPSSRTTSEHLGRSVLRRDQLGSTNFHLWRCGDSEPDATASVFQHADSNSAREDKFFVVLS
jgi:hypothetical protein